MVKVCHVTSVHPRYDIRIYQKQCISLAKQGYQVTLLVNDNKEDEVICGVNIKSCRYQSKNRITRMFLSTRLIYDKAKEINADIYCLHDPELLGIGLKLKRAGKKVIFDSHEYYTDEILTEKLYIPKMLRWIIAKTYNIYEAKTVKKLDAVISVTPQFIEYFSQLNRNAVLITNYPILDNGNVLQKHAEKCICFAGSITRQWCHDKIITALANLDDVTYLLAGNADEAYLSYLTTLEGWNKVKFYGRITHDEVNELYAKSMIGVAVNYTEQIKGKGTLGNTKLFEFMQAELPVICSDYELWKEIIDNNNCGIYVNPLDTREIEEAIRFLIKNQDIAKEMGIRGRAAVEHNYNWSAEEKKLFDLYDKLILRES